MLKCRYAGDLNDEVCINCNGIDVEVKTGIFKPACDFCAAYEAAYQPPEKKESIKPSEMPLDSLVTACNETNINLSNEDKNALQPIIQGLTTKISFSSSVSSEIKGSWYKFTCTEERELPADCDLEAERKDLWNTINAEVDKQLADVM